jgi:hypothetical protein
MKDGQMHEHGPQDPNPPGGPRGVAGAPGEPMIHFPHREAMTRRLTGFMDTPRAMSDIYAAVVDVLAGREASPADVMADLRRVIAQRAGQLGPHVQRLARTAMPLFVATIIDDESGRTALLSLVDADRGTLLPDPIDVEARLLATIHDREAAGGLYPRVAQVLGGRRLDPTDVALLVALAINEYTRGVGPGTYATFHAHIDRLVAAVVDDVDAEREAVGFIQQQQASIDEQLRES